MRCRFARSCEKLNEHSRKLPPLPAADYVFVQNQNGPLPSKWDKSRIVVDTKSNDQYAIKISGSSQLTET